MGYQGQNSLQCIFLLSTKSAGSSILQRRLVEGAVANVVPYTRHHENETLFWTKAASVLGLKQQKMPNSEVPIPKPTALKDLRLFMAQNAPDFDGNLASEADMFAAWTHICRCHGPRLVEKSPHHLYQPSVVGLLERYADASPEVTVHFLGLVRNPMDTLYSSWRRFGITPEIEERHWARAYRTLRELRQRHPASVAIIRYEDLVTDQGTLDDLFRWLRVPISRSESSPFHDRSIRKWQTDERFGFALKKETRDLAMEFGYREADLENEHRRSWFVYRIPRAAAYGILSALPSKTQMRVRHAAGRLIGHH